MWKLLTLAKLTIGTPIALAWIAIAGFTPAIAVAQQGFYAPANDHCGGWVGQADPKNGIPQTRALTASEREALERMVEEAEFFAAGHPEYAPAVNAFRECVLLERARRATMRADIWFWTLQDLYREAGGVSRSIEPGGRNPSDGDILPPNVLIINDGLIDGPRWTDPSSDCAARMRAILTVIHEGNRQLQVGTVVSFEDIGPDCDLLAGMISTYWTDVEVLSDLMANGLPPSCALTARDVGELERNLQAAYEHLASVCDEAQAKACQLPPECG